MNEWRPMDEWPTYRHKCKPGLVLFRYAPTEPRRLGGSVLRELYTLEHPYGSRICTHFMHVNEIAK